MPDSLHRQSQEVLRCSRSVEAYMFVVARDAADESVDAATQGACTIKGSQVKSREEQSA